MAGGKRKHRGLQTYGRANNYKHAHQRVSFLRAQELFFPSSDQPSQHLDTTPDHGHSAGASQREQTLPGQTHDIGATAGRKHTASSLKPDLGRKTIAKPASTPTKPGSAKMAVEPNVNDVEMVISFAGCSRDQAIRYLKVKKDAQTAINSIMDGEDISREEQGNSWDESAWSSDRNGNPTMGDNNLHPLGGTSTAPTRVPSPAMNMGMPANRDDEDAQLAQALAASREGPYEQETGILHANGASEQTYGPVNKDQSAHDRQWGMILASQNASSEIVPDVERPEERKNAEGEPRFLKTLPSGDYLPNFLTIGHSIPAVREALLMRDYIMVNYGSDPEWWRGNTIALPKIVHTADGAPADSEIDKYDEFIAETQRLMAALDASQRSYASVNALTKTELLLSGDNNTMTENFINKFCNAADSRTNNYELLISLFMTYIGTTSPEGMRMPCAAVFPLDIKTMGEEKIQLMEVLDGLLWDTDTEASETKDNYITSAGDVIVMQAQATDPSAEKLKLEVPPTLYIDKYLQKNIEISRPARVEIAKEKERVAKIKEIETKLTKWQVSGRQIDARTMLQHTLGHFSGRNMADAGKADLENGVVVNGTCAAEQPHYADIAAKLETIIANVDKKLERLAEQKESIQKNISKLSNSSPSQLQQEGLKERYTLMGVATKPSITYVLRPKEEQEEDDDDDHMSTDNDDEATPDGMQWWRIEYVVNGSQPRISKSKVEGDIVIQAVEVEHTSALLVYASDRAVDDSNYDPSLPPALQQFIDGDDLHLNVELHDAMRSQPPPSYDYAQEGDIPRPSIEPGARRPSIDSTIAELDGASTRGSPISGPAYYNNPPPGAGIPPAITSSAEHVEDPEVTEIHLSPSGDADVGNSEYGGGGAQHQEMVETKHGPFVPGLQQQRRSEECDAAMEDARDEKRQEW